jgi:dihydroorotate dehydrogenase
MLYRDLILKLLLLLPPETAQNLAETALRCKAPWVLIGKYNNMDTPELNTKICEISLSSPIGLAAGFDKDFRMLDSLSELDFGYITAGTVILNPQQGHPKPRLIRDVTRNSLLNSMGFPSKGLEFAIESIKSMSSSRLSPIFGSISGTDINSIQISCAGLSPFISGIEINISSPNTSGLKTFHDPVKLSEMIKTIRDTTDKPLIIKLPPHSNETNEIDIALKLADSCISSGADGITVSNSRPVKDSRLAVGEGGLSGALLIQSTLRMVSSFRSYFGSGIIINACGGIFTGDDVFNALLAGANTAQLYTALVYRGPFAIRHIKKELLTRMRVEGIKKISEIKFN